MASIHADKRRGKTTYRCQFYDKHKRRRSIRLGSINKRAAEGIALRIDDLVSASISGGSPSNETARFLATIGDDLATKFTQAGFGDFIPKRESATLGPFLKTYIGGRESEVGPGTSPISANLNGTSSTFLVPIGTCGPSQKGMRTTGGRIWRSGTPKPVSASTSSGLAKCSSLRRGRY